MSEVTIQPTPLVWMGAWDEMGAWDRDRHPYVVGWAMFASGRVGVHREVNPALDRPPILVHVPMGRRDDGLLYAMQWCIDGFSTVSHQPWQVTVDMDSLVVGQQPLITVAPSIHIVGYWHGWLEQGILHN